MHETEIFVTILVAAIGSGIFNRIFDTIVNIRSTKADKETAVMKAARLLMKSELRMLCRHYITQGWIYDDELEDIMAMHAVYHDDLNGNGYLNEMMERVKDLEIRGIGVK